MKVIIGLSGGVDSAVAAYLLKQRGYDVEGLFMRNWDSSLNNDFLGNPDLTGHDICPQEEDYKDALEVAAKLGIKLHRSDFVEEYWEQVFMKFLEEVKKGRTPNPDVLCNRFIKFDAFLKEAKKLGADKIATGHYAKYEDGYLKLSKDTNKDQTYFLSYLDKEQLKDVIFPLDNLTKDEVREIARNIGLNVASKKDSTGICFIGERNYAKFLKNYLKDNEGDVVDITSEKVIGRHNGLMYYTIGQGKGLNLDTAGVKYFVCGKDTKRNILYVTPADHAEYLMSDAAFVENPIFNCDLRPQEVYVRFRHRAPLVKAKAIYLDGEVYITYDKFRAVTPGQEAAFYYNDICIGGGAIKSVHKNNCQLWYIVWP